MRHLTCLCLSAWLHLGCRTSSNRKLNMGPASPKVSALSKIAHDLLVAFGRERSAWFGHFGIPVVNSRLFWRRKSMLRHCRCERAEKENTGIFKFSTCIRDRFGSVSLSCLQRSKCAMAFPLPRLVLSGGMGFFFAGKRRRRVF